MSEKPAIEKYSLLPRIKGPKLGRFLNGRYKKIEYLELLGSSQDQLQPPDGEHGYVFKVLIDSEVFALKIFRFFDPETERCQMSPWANSQISDEDLEGQTDPFFAECRAYGRIASRKRKRPIAVACHGFISVPAETETFFAKQFNVVEWDRPDDELLKEPPERQPFRALVKDFVETDIEITDAIVKSMLRELRALHSMKIYVMDVSTENYKGGHLVDLSASYTEPHFMFRREIRSDLEISRNRGQDLYDFDVMIEELGIQTSVRALRNKDKINRLRPRQKNT